MFVDQVKINLKAGTAVMVSSLIVARNMYLSEDRQVETAVKGHLSYLKWMRA